MKRNLIDWWKVKGVHIVQWKHGGLWIACVKKNGSKCERWLNIENSIGCTFTEYTNKEMSKIKWYKLVEEARKRNTDQASARLSTYTQHTYHQYAHSSTQYICVHCTNCHWLLLSIRLHIDIDLETIKMCLHNKMHTHATLTHTGIITKYLKFSSIIFRPQIEADLTYLVSACICVLCTNSQLSYSIGAKFLPPLCASFQCSIIISQFHQFTQYCWYSCRVVFEIVLRWDKMFTNHLNVYLDILNYQFRKGFL